MSWKPMDELENWSVNKYACSFTSGRPTKVKISTHGKWKLNKLKEQKNTDIRFTAQKKVNGVWVTTDIPLDIQEMVQNAYKELEPITEVGPLHHIAEVEEALKYNAVEARPQLQEDTFVTCSPDDLCIDCLAEKQRVSDGWVRLYNAITEPHDYDLFCCCSACITTDDWLTKEYCDTPDCGCGDKYCVRRDEGRAEEQMMRDDKKKALANGEKWEPYVYNPEDHVQMELTHEEKLACKNETKYCDGWPFCSCDQYEPVTKGMNLDIGGELHVKEDVYFKPMTVERTYSIFDCDGGKPVEFNPLGPDAPTVVNEKGGKQSKVEGFFMGLPAKAIIEVAKVLEHGREKYGKDNWRNIDSESHLNHLQMHIYGDMTGDRSEGDVGHLAHAACRALMALEMAIEERGG